jgi:actin-like ATPase involved in cell morphogenesis
LDRGLFLCGGLAPLGPLTQRLQRTTGLAVLSAREPAHCTVRGLQKLLSDPSRWGSLIDNS